MKDLKTIYQYVKEKIYPECEDFEVIQKIEEFRSYWKPEKTRVVLLAESHVHTLGYELNTSTQYPKDLLSNDYPKGFTRFVYCLAYGERRTVIENISPNKGTPQYWQIFFSCINYVKNNSDFKPIYITGTPNHHERLTNKFNLLNQLKSRGIWLIDASLFALSKPGANRPADDKKEKILHYSWDNYIENTIQDLQPKFIIVIGKSVGKTLKREISKIIDNDYRIVSQPQDHMTKEVRMAVFKQYFEICSNYAI